MDPVTGTYALILESGAARAVLVGRLGRLSLAPGWYVYVGSAFGPGGLRARCAHHLRIAAKPHWHIDYLRTATQVREIWYTHDPHPREHQWAEQILCARGAMTPFPGFGATDCRCLSHLSFHCVYPSLSAFRRRLFRRCPGHSTVCNYAVVGVVLH